VTSLEWLCVLVIAWVAVSAVERALRRRRDAALARMGARWTDDGILVDERGEPWA
jgi:flagellar biosynthesis/type III secretory pathway M-ring protein FliF/YscJ